MPSPPLRVDPPFCDCGDCFAGRSVPLSGADWQTVRALFDGTVENASGTELITIIEDERPEPWVVVCQADQETWPDQQTWAWKLTGWEGS
jgi:hypothetical protein